MQIRYIIASILIPAVIITYFTLCIFFQNAQWLFYSANFMLFLVGWHYTKQSYGMLITLSALKKIYYSETDKKVFLYNSYIVWITTWIYMNNAISNYNFYGAELSFFKFHPLILLITLISSIISSLLCILALLVKYMKENKISLNGIVGYSTGYIWLMLRWSDPITYLLIPMFHSLQYLPFVLRYKINETHVNAHATTAGAKKAVLGFIAWALFLGFMGFHGLPWLFDSYVPYDTTIYGNTLFLFIFVVFINIHHYFIDNFLWRKENKEVSKYLFYK